MISDRKIPQRRDASRQWFWPVAAGLLATLALVQILTIRQESQTWDEGFEIASGYSFLKTGDYRISLEQPPVGRILSAVPLLWLNPSLPLDHPSWRQRDEVAFGREFLYGNRVPADRLLFWARMPTILATFVLGLALALWTRSAFGPTAALCALALFAFDPNIIAYGRYAKNDMLVTLWSLMATVAWADYLRGGRRRSLMAAGLLLGLAVGTKFSAIFLLPVFAILVLFRALETPNREQGRETVARGLRALLIAAAMGAGVTVAAYGPEIRMLMPATRAGREADPSIRMLRDVADARTATGRAMRWAGNRLGLPAHPLLEGINDVASHNFDGHESYLLGMHGKTGWWYYFPIAFAVKTPVATLILLFISLAAAGRRMVARVGPRSQFFHGWITASTFRYAVALVPIAVYGSLAMLAHIDIGLRHLLPVYPLLFALLGAAMARWRPRYAVAACALLMVESLAAYPDYLAFFNAAAGGPSQGPKYLLDSNLDWGQDAIKLKSWMNARGVREVCTCYFGTAELAHYGIAGPNVPPTRDRRREADCFAAISVTALYGNYVAPGDYTWLRSLQPVAKIGYSIYVYDLRRNSETGAER
ncbi:MAG TPA: glycosyltransferase family 39 protein [Bryobacteraceae bacterium]